MPGPDPGIHSTGLSANSRGNGMDYRVKPGNDDGWVWASLESRTLLRFRGNDGEGWAAMSPISRVRNGSLNRPYATAVRGIARGSISTAAVISRAVAASTQNSMSNPQLACTQEIIGMATATPENVTT